MNQFEVKVSIRLRPSVLDPAGEAIKSAAGKLGVNDIDQIKMDTFQKKDQFFSYRRSKKMGEEDYGRCISVISLL